MARLVNPPGTITILIHIFMSTHMIHNLWVARSLILLAVAGTVALVSYSYYALQAAQYASERTATITVSGTGEVLVVPDIGTFSFAVVEEADTAAAAQAAATEANNAIMAYLKDTANIAEADIKTTDYNLQPRYRFLDPSAGSMSRERELIGYEVQQRVEVLVRDTDQAGQLLVGVGERGASNISNLTFTIDDESTYIDEARELAITDAQDRAERLAAQLGVRVVRIVDYYEQEGHMPPFMARTEAATLGMGGDAIAPDISVGENTVLRRVNVTYEVR